MIVKAGDKIIIKDGEMVRQVTVVIAKDGVCVKAYGNGKPFENPKVLSILK